MQRTIGRYVRGPRKELKRAPFFAGYTEGIINICYSTYSARAAPFHPTTWRTGRTLNTLSPFLYVHVAYTRAPNRRIAVLAIDRERKPLSPRTSPRPACMHALRAPGRSLDLRVRVANRILLAGNSRLFVPPLAGPMDRRGSSWR